jgi:hypothetical protein
MRRSESTFAYSGRLHYYDIQHINATHKHHQQDKMALPLPPGLTPSEVGFLAEMELVTVIPRQRLESLELLGVSSSRRPA